MCSMGSDTVESSRVDADDDEPQTFGVYLHDDSFNMREYVARTLMMIAEVSEEDASNIMMQANWGGRALVGTFEKDLAEHTYKGMQKAGLAASIRLVSSSEDDDDSGGYFRW